MNLTTLALRLVKHCAKKVIDVILVNSNPATIMTDPDTANRTYIEPLTPELVEKVIIKERPDALLPTMGGQTALNIAVSLAKSGVLEKYGVELIGAKLAAIEMAEDRLLFKEAMARIGVPVCPSGIATSPVEAREVSQTDWDVPADYSSRLYPGRCRRWHRLQSRGI